MHRLTAAAPLLAATALALFCAPASAHHSQSMFDTSKELVLEGTVSRFDWVNPHMYLIVETIGPDGKPALVKISKTFQNRRPLTMVALTGAGRKRFREYLAQLEKVLRDAAAEEADARAAKDKARPGLTGA